jgi:hypothetical protein
MNIGEVVSGREAADPLGLPIRIGAGSRIPDWARDRRAADDLCDLQRHSASCRAVDRTVARMQRSGKKAMLGKDLVVQRGKACTSFGAGPGCLG